MVSGVETGLIIRVNSAFAGAAFGQRGSDGTPFNAITDPTAENTSVTGVGGAAESSVIRPFGNGEPKEGDDEGPFFSRGLNGLLAPPSIAAIQEERDPAGDNGSGDVSGSENGIAQPSAPADGAGPDAASADGEEETGPGELTEEEEELVQDLKQRDAEVRRHEQAHKAVGGQYAGSISYTYQAGPDGRRYAVGGEVPIDASPIPGDPEATIRKLEQVRSAALAPAEPSGADRAVASQATQGIQQARAEQAQQSAEELRDLTEGDDGAETSSETASAPAAPEPGADAPPSAGIDGGSPFVSEGGTSEGTNGSPFSVVANLGGQSSEGPFGIERSGQSGSGSAADIEEAGNSPFSFTPSVGRATLDVSV
ncbi:putative metalloprotease CJM1_0395 family protein [Nisaea sediminum]|uniref:putative metalloprotease CJM1_0395 family protein n=1 Tax=Nisaea sediminum TaxID=2775867 RepID=UPI001866EC05|nr:putative metalloprotease CJM1_0395 family protein [Nisaea sediminum]